MVKNTLGRLLQLLCPGLVSRLQQQVRAARKIKNLRWFRALTTHQGPHDRLDRKIRRYEEFYDRVRFPWDPKAKDIG